MNGTNYAPVAEKISTENDWYDIYATPNTGFYSFAQTNDGKFIRDEEGDAAEADRGEGEKEGGEEKRGNAKSSQWRNLSFFF
jgi:hypothetical protein